MSERLIYKDPESEAMDVEDSPEVRNMPKWPTDVNKIPELEKHALSALPRSVLLREIHGAIFPVYTINARVVGIEPSLTDLYELVRGHCPHYTCTATVTSIVWANAGPLTYGKLPRPYCPECCQTRRKRYLNLYFHLELVIEDNLGEITRIEVSRDMAVRFFGCTVYRFLMSNKLRLKIKKGLAALLEASNSPRSAAVPGVTYDIRIIPIATQEYEKVKFLMYGDNLPLFQIVRKLPKA